MKTKLSQYFEVGIIFIIELLILIIAPMLVSLTGSNTVSMLIKYLIYIIMTGVVIIALRLDKKEVFSWLGLRKKDIGKQVISSLPAFVFTAFIFVVMPLLFGIDKASWLGYKRTSLISIIMYVIHYMVFVGPGEEIIFRGYILGKVQELTNSGVKAVIISSLLFGLWHFPVGWSILQVIMTALIGAVYGFARLKLKNCTTLSVGIAHGLHDTFILLLGYILL